MKAAIITITIVAIALALGIAVKISASEQAKDNPPVACQILGGQWNIWNGWECG